MRRSDNLFVIFLSFFKVGLTSFGGHAALVSILQQEFVEKRKLITENDVVTAFSIASVLPGPIAVNVVAYIGYRLHGWLGAIASLIAVIFPPSIIIILIAKFYTVYSNFEWLNSILYGIIPVIIGFLFSLCFNLMTKGVTNLWQYGVGVIVLILVMFYNSYLMMVLYISIGALIGILNGNHNEKSYLKVSFYDWNGMKSIYLGFITISGLLLMLYFWLDGIEQLLYTEFSKISVTLFGGGYVVIPMLHQIVVDKFQWLSTSEFTHAIAFAQITPGPILISATYIGYIAGGISGAIVATIGIFLPASVIMITASSLFENIKDHPKVIAAFQGIRPVVIALIAYSGWVLFRSLEQYWISGGVVVMAYILIVYAKLDYLLLIILGGILGLLFL